MSVQVASWALDGISVLATERTLVDHGVSLLAQKDCAIWRGIKGEKFCTNDDPVLMVAMKAKSDNNALDAQSLDAQSASLANFETAAGEPPRTPHDHGPAADVMEFVDAWAYLQGLETAETAAVTAKSSLKLAALADFKTTAHPMTGDDDETASSIRSDHGPSADVMEFVDAWAYQQGFEIAKSVTASVQSSPDSATLANFETAAGTAESGEEIAALDLPSSEFFGLGSSRFASAKLAWRRSVVAASNNMPSTKPSSGGETTVAGSKPSDKSVSGLYFIIGSLSRVADINGFSKRRWQVGSQVVVSRLDGRELYREVVGPFPRSQQANVRGRLTQAGIRDAWLAFLEPALWQLVPPSRVEETLAMTERQIASAL